MNDLKILNKELFKTAFKNFERQHVQAGFPNQIWSVDLVDVSNVKQTNKKFTFLLNIVDVYSRYAWSFPLKSKRAEEVLAAFKEIGKIPEKIWADEGKEFYNGLFKEWCKENDILLYSTHSGLKSVFAERFNRTMKEAFYLYFANHLHTSYLKFLPIFMDEYNHRIHSSTKKTPDELYHTNVLSNEYHAEKENPPDAKFKIGDYVRLSKVKRTFEKGYTSRYTHEAFKVTSVSDNYPYLYQVDDLMGEPIEGKVYEKEMILTKVPFFKIINKIVKKNKKKVSVSYIGYPEKFNEEIPESDYKKFMALKNMLREES
jgi:hypothetical protein